MGSPSEIMMICLGAARVAGEQLLGEQQRVLHVGAEHVFVPLQEGEFPGFQFLGISREADDVEAVLGVLRGDEVVQREGDLLGGLEGAAQGH